MIENPSFLDEYTKQLGFSWNMSCAYVPVDDTDPYPNINLVSDRESQSHRILIPETFRKYPEEEYRTLVVENMVRAKFVEKIDPIFGSTYFHPRLVDMPDYEKWKWEIWYAQQHAEIWANDHLSTYFGAKEGKKMQEESVDTYLEQFFSLQREGFDITNPILQTSTQFVSASAQRSALMRYRSPIQEARKAILGRLDSNQADQYKNLEAIYMKLPRLPLDNPNKAIAIFDITTQQVAQARGISVMPQLGKYEDKFVWDIKE